MSVDSFGQIHNMSTKINPYGTGDLQVVFGSSSSSMSWYFQSAPINMWSKCKPFISSSTFTDRYTSSNSSRLSALAAAGYGMSHPTYNWDPGNIYSQGWSYSRPNGSSSQPWRALDFDEYCSGAKPPFTPLGNLTVSVDSRLDFKLCVDRSFSVGGMSFDEYDVGSFYLCAVFSTVSNFTGTLKLKTSSQVINQRLNDNLSLYIESSELSTLRNSGYGYYYICGRNVAQTSLVNYSFINGVVYCVLPSHGSLMSGSLTIEQGYVPPTPSYSVPFTVSAGAGLNLGTIEIYAGTSTAGWGTSLDGQSLAYQGSGNYDIGDLEFQTTATTIVFGVVVSQNPGGTASLHIEYGSYSSSSSGTYCEVSVPASAINSSITLTASIN